MLLELFTKTKISSKPLTFGTLIQVGQEEREVITHLASAIDVVGSYLGTTKPTSVGISASSISGGNSRWWLQSFFQIL
jgi:hypothetical protein